jgi:hypothetical protein
MLHKDILAIIVLFSVAIGCTSTDRENSTYAFIGGEIINPKNNTVVLYSTDGEFIDSITLDINNRFIHKI